jgi:hypothetical protein
MLPVCAFLFLFLISLEASAGASAPSSPSSVTRGTRVSVNLFDAWYNRLPGGHGRNVSMQHMKEACSFNGFDVIRVATAPYWPLDAKLLTDDEPQVNAPKLMCQVVTETTSTPSVLGSNG